MCCNLYTELISVFHFKRLYVQLKMFGGLKYWRKQKMPSGLGIAWATILLRQQKRHKFFQSYKDYKEFIKLVWLQTGPAAILKKNPEGRLLVRCNGIF